MREASDVRRTPEKEVTQPARRTFNEEYKLKALELGGAIGRRAAIRELGISPSVFQRFTEQYPKQWSEAIRGRDPELIGKALAAQFEELIEGYTEAEQKAVQRALDLLTDGDEDEEGAVRKLDAKETAALIKAMGSSRGVAAVNARQARGEPDKTVDVNINFPQLEQAAEAILAAAPPPPLPVPNLEE